MSHRIGISGNKKNILAGLSDNKSKQQKRTFSKPLTKQTKPIQPIFQQSQKAQWSQQQQKNHFAFSKPYIPEDEYEEIAKELNKIPCEIGYQSFEHAFPYEIKQRPVRVFNCEDFDFADTELDSLPQFLEINVPHRKYEPQVLQEEITYFEEIQSEEGSDTESTKQTSNQNQNQEENT